MRILLVGTDLAPVRTGAGALESLLAGWAGGLSADGHLVQVVGIEGTGVPGVASSSMAAPECLGEVTRSVRPDVVVLNNRPGWQRWVEWPTLHLFHNWPDAWATDDLSAVGAASVPVGVAAVSRALADVAARELGRDPGDVAVVTPFAAAEYFAVDRRPVPRTVLAPNRLLEKKGVRQVLAAMQQPALRGRRVLVTDFLSPWVTPTEEHRALRTAVLTTTGAVLVEPPTSRAAMASLYASAEVVVVPSVRPEGLGMAAVEAQAVGVPVVASGLGGLGEAILPGSFVADPFDPEALADAVVRAARATAADRSRLRDEARARWSMAASVGSLTRALNRVAGS